MIQLKLTMKSGQEHIYDLPDTVHFAVSDSWGPEGTKRIQLQEEKAFSTQNIQDLWQIIKADQLEVSEIARHSLVLNDKEIFSNTAPVVDISYTISYDGSAYLERIDITG